MGEVEKVGNKEDSSSMVRWEKFLPKIAIRVLLVEADDSTRQIIGALLRKCSYKVASVPDGLKAWEVLKARPHSIDLILTEVDLPSISGYALLTLIMEHEICRNIPVIMMSTHDPVSTVYKCMLRGAADFLVKPIRINELKNLWQHVWRRLSMSGPGIGPQDENTAQEKLEVTAENHATSKHSSGLKACSIGQEECVKKGSDAQSSCGKIDLETESGYTSEGEDHSPPKHIKSLVSDSETQEHRNCANFGQDLHDENAVAGSHTANGKDDATFIREESLVEQNQGENVNNYTQSGQDRNVISNSSEVDLIGAFCSHSRLDSCVNHEANKFESSPSLDLSLRGSHSNHEKITTCKKPMLNHSNSSAFTRYVNKPLCSSNANATSSFTSKGNKVNPDDLLSNNSPCSNPIGTKDPSIPYGKKVISLPVNVAKEVENERQTFYSGNTRGSEVSVHQDGILPGCSGSGNEQCHGDHDLTRQRSIRREAALAKFRLKRKERCFEKKVRYESRKKLAEQRPRVKGQFIRQVPTDPTPS